MMTMALKTIAITSMKIDGRRDYVSLIIKTYH